MSMTIPNKENKIQQENFRTYSDLRIWLSNNGYKNTGYVLVEPWKEFFVERWEKNDLIAFSMNVLDMPKWDTLPLSTLNKPYQVDIARMN